MIAPSEPFAGGRFITRGHTSAAPKGSFQPGAAEHFDPTVEEQHWRSNFDREPYYQRGMTFDDYAPAYRIGGEARGRYGDASFDDVEDPQPITRVLAEILA